MECINNQSMKIIALKKHPHIITGAGVSCQCIDDLTVDLKIKGTQLSSPADKKVNIYITVVGFDLLHINICTVSGLQGVWFTRSDPVYIKSLAHSCIHCKLKTNHFKFYYVDFL